MTSDDDRPDVAEQLARQVAELAQSGGRTVAVAESLTGGTISTRLSAAPSSATWFRGGVVAYAADVKFQVLDVPPGPVVTASCAAAMASGVARLLGADAAVAVTGVGGPDDEEGEPPGTVFLAAVLSGVPIRSERHRFVGEPDDVVTATTERALGMLVEALQHSPPAPS